MQIDVVMPTKNSERTIGRVLDAMLSALGSRSYQLIIVDGGSTDNTLKIVHHKVENPIVLTENMGSQALAVNMGIKASKHQYICFLDSDILVPKNFFTKLLAHFSDPNVGAVEAGLFTVPGSAIYNYELSYQPLELKGTIVVKSASRACLVVRREILDFKVDNRLKVAEDTNFTQQILGVRKRKIIRDHDVICTHIRDFHVWGDFKRGMRYWYYQGLNYYLLPKGLSYREGLKREIAKAILYVGISFLVIPLPFIWVLRLRHQRERKLKYGAMGWLFKLGCRIGILAGFVRWAKARPQEMSHV